MKTAFQQQFDMMASGIIHEAIQFKGDGVSKNVYTKCDVAFHIDCFENYHESA